MKKIFLILCVICNSALFAQINEKDNEMRWAKIKKIYKYQDKRNGVEIEKFFADTDKYVISRAVISLANVQDTVFVPSLVKLLKESDVYIKSRISFALGQMGACRLSSQTLLDELRSSEDISYRTVLFESIGRTGTENFLDAILLLPVQNSSEDVGKIWGVTRFALRGIKNKSSIGYLLDKLNSNDEEIKLRAAYALWRSSTSSVIVKEDIPNILQHIEKSGPAMKSYLINALGPLPVNDTVKQTLLKSLNDELSVQLSAIKILEKYNLKRSEFETILENKSNTNEHLNLARYRLLYKAGFTDSTDKVFISGKIKSLLASTKITWRERAELDNGLASLEGDKVLDLLLKETLSKNERFAAKIIKTIGDINSVPAMKALLYKVQAKAPIPVISLIESITKLRKIVVTDSVDIRQTKKIFLIALKSNNVGKMASVATALNNLQFVDLIPCPDLISAYNKLKLPDDQEGMVEFINLFKNYADAGIVSLLEREVNSESILVSKAALTSLEDLSDKDYIRTVKTPDKLKVMLYDWVYFEKLSIAPFIEINTEEGKIKIELFPGEAPFTCISIAKLIDKKYFDGLVFHRVVSNFVIQGGDPQGTGSGGPGYSIRTEISQVKFGAGYVGMASAGRDTEGSQFFITHSPQPHLDGKYTIFGKVVEGMDTVNKIQEGDKIISIKRLK